MADIEIHMKNGPVESFPDRGRAGGSYSNTVRYDGGFVIVKDCWGKETAFPAVDVKKVVVDPGRSW